MNEKGKKQNATIAAEKKKFLLTVVLICVLSCIVTIATTVTLISNRLSQPTAKNNVTPATTLISMTIQGVPLTFDIEYECGSTNL